MSEYVKKIYVLITDNYIENEIRISLPLPPPFFPFPFILKTFKEYISAEEAWYI